MDNVKALISYTCSVFLTVALGLALVQPAEARVTGLPDFTGLVAESAPAVVNIRVTQYGERARQRRGQQQSPFGNDEIPELFRRYFGPDDPYHGSNPDRMGAGSGFIIDSDGYVVTNHHVVDGADQIIVRLPDLREFEAELVGSDEQSDIALLKVDAKGLPTLRFGDSDQLRQGEWVIAIGSPFNFDQTVTAGIVSAKGRSNNSQQYVPFIQTDVAINRGNSGGPLLNLDGEVVGVNSWILSNGSGSYIGLSFAIPVSTVASTVRQLRETGKVSRGLLGVMVGPVTRELAEAMQLDRPVGALVNDVSEGGAAERAGIEPGDIILAFNQQTVETSNDLPPLVGANPPGTEAVVTVSRNGKQREFDVVLDALSGEDGEELAQQGQEPERSNVLGLAVEGLTVEQRRQGDIPDGGVLITDIESDSAWRAGLRAGDVILSINNKPVGSISDFDEMVGDLPKDRAVMLRIWREGSTQFLAFTPDVEDVG
jgi:serine protease Do